MAGLLACLAALVTACSGASNGDGGQKVRSALSRGMLTCDNETKRDCASRGTLRWSLPLDGTYAADMHKGTVDYIQPARTEGGVVRSRCGPCTG